MLFFLFITFIQLSFSSTLSQQFITNYFTDDDITTWTINGFNAPTNHLYSDCDGVRLMGGYQVFIGYESDPISIEKTWSNLPPHYQITISMQIYKIDSWNDEELFVMIDNSTVAVYTWDENSGTSDICGETPPSANQYNSQYNELIVSFNHTLNHTDSDLTLKIVSSLRSQIGAWGIRSFLIQFQRCHSSCSTCTDSNLCISCDAGLVFVNPYCECPLGQRIVSVQQCYTQSCVSCSNTGCPSGYYILNSSVCSSCNQACSVCTGPGNSMPSCSACATGFTFSSSSVCQNCYGGCSACTGLNYNECTACEIGYFLSNNQCLSNCPSAYYGVQHLSACYSCVSPCENCDGSTTSNCLSCINGMYLLQFSCYSTCPSNYYSYNGECISECPLSTYSNSTRLCEDCPSFCETCTSTGVCRLCQSNTFFNEDDELCYDVCPNGYYGDQQNYVCLQCDSTCLTCVGPSASQCQSCYPLSFLVYDACYSTCPSHTYSTTCQLCHDNCLNCSGPSKNECTSCYEPMMYHLNQSICIQNCYEGDIPDNEEFTCLTCANGYVGVFLVCQKCSSTCSSCFGTTYLQCKTCEDDSKFQFTTCTLQDEEMPIVSMPDLQNSDTVVKQILIIVLLVNLFLTLVMECFFKYKTNLLPCIQVAQIISYLYYFSIPFSQSTQQIFILLFNAHPSLILSPVGLLNILPQFQNTHPHEELIITKILLTSKKAIFLLDSLNVHLIFIICLIILGFSKILKGYAYHKLYPYIVAYSYRLLFMQHIFSQVSDTMLGISLGLLLVDVGLVVGSLGWKIRTDTERSQTHLGLFYFNEMGKKYSQQLSLQQEQQSESIFPSLVYYIGKIPLIIIILVFSSKPFSQAISFLAYAILLTVINCALPFRRRIYANITHFSNASFILIGILLLLISLQYNVHIYLDYVILAIFMGMLMVSLVQVVANYNFWRVIPKYCWVKVRG